MKALLLLFTAVVLALSVVDCSSRLIFLGDSVLDTGANTPPGLITCDYPPYGVSVWGPTGRCSDGYLVSDFIAYGLGIPVSFPLPPDSDGNVPVTINLASFNTSLTSLNGTTDVPLSRQIVQLQVLSTRMNDLAEALVVVSIGANDLLSFDFVNGTTVVEDVPTPTIDSFVSTMRDELYSQLDTLISIGARRILLLGLGPLGCSPLRINGTVCDDQLNEGIRSFNEALETYNYSSSDAKGLDVMYLDGYAALDYIAFNFTYTKEACCPECFERHHASDCNDPSVYLYWDSLHPTEEYNSELTQLIFHGNNQVIRPHNLLNTATGLLGPSPPGAAAPPPHHASPHHASPHHAAPHAAPAPAAAPAAYPAAAPAHAAPAHAAPAHAAPHAPALRTPPAQSSATANARSFALAATTLLLACVL